MKNERAGFVAGSRSAAAGARLGDRAFAPNRAGARARGSSARAVPSSVIASLALRWAYRISTGSDPGRRFAFHA